MKPELYTVTKERDRGRENGRRMMIMIHKGKGEASKVVEDPGCEGTKLKEMKKKRGQAERCNVKIKGAELVQSG